MRINKNTLFNIFILFISSYVSYVFINASLSKIADPISFSNSISAYEIMPYWSVNLIALFFHWLELICGISLLVFMIIRVLRWNVLSEKEHPLFEVSVNIIMLMLVWFIIILSIAAFRGLDIDCGCGTGEKVLPSERLIEDIVLFIMIIFIKYRMEIGVKFE